MKAKVTTKSNATANATATVVVPAALKTAVASVASAITGRVSAVKREGQSWVETAQVLTKLFKTKEDASPVLKQAFEDAKLTDGMFAAYRSNILTLAYPADPVAAKQAAEDGLPTHQRVAAARGSLKKSKKKDGGWIKVKRAEKRGGHNKIKPLDKATADAALLATHCQTAKLDEDQIGVFLAKAFEEAGFDLEAIADVIAKA